MKMYVFPFSQLLFTYKYEYYYTIMYNNVNFLYLYILSYISNDNIFIFVLPPCRLMGNSFSINCLRRPRQKCVVSQSRYFSTLGLHSLKHTHLQTHIHTQPDILILIFICNFSNILAGWNITTTYTDRQIDIQILDTYVDRQISIYISTYIQLNNEKRQNE